MCAREAMDQDVPTGFEVLCYPGVAALLEISYYVFICVHFCPPSTHGEAPVFKARITLKEVARRHFLAVDDPENVLGL